VLNDRLSLARPQLQTKCSSAAFPKLFTCREVERRFLLLQCHAPPPCLPPDIKDSLKEDVGFFDGEWVDWWAAWENDAAGGLLSCARD
jgi:hypothetical protein